MFAHRFYSGVGEHCVSLWYAPEGVSFVFVFFVDVFEAAVVLGVDPAVVVVLVSYPDLEFTRMVL